MVADSHNSGKKTAEDLTAALWLAEQSTSDAMMKRLAQRGFDDIVANFLIIVYLLEPGETSRAVLAKETGLSRPALNRLLRPLIERGYVEPITKPNGTRSPLVRQTTRGIELISAYREVNLELQALAAKTLGKDNAVRVHQQLDRLRSVFASIATGSRVAAPPPSPKSTQSEQTEDDHTDCFFFK